MCTGVENEWKVLDAEDDRRSFDYSHSWTEPRTVTAITATITRQRGNGDKKDEQVYFDGILAMYKITLELKKNLKMIIK